MDTPIGTARMAELARNQDSDAMEWAKAFAQSVRTEGMDPTDEGWLVGVFANAMSTVLPRSTVGDEGVHGERVDEPVVPPVDLQHDWRRKDGGSSAF